MKKILWILSVSALCLICACAPEDKQVSDTPQTQKTLLDEMTVEEKVGQLLFVRCPEQEYTDEVMSYSPGGILMFGRDFEGLTKDEVTDKIQSLQSMSKIPLIIGADEEGGTVVRVSSNPNLAPEKF